MTTTKATDKNYKPTTKKFKVDTKLGTEPTEIELIKAKATSDAVTRLCLRDQKVIAIHVTFDVNGKFEIFHFGAAPEISKRATYLAERIAESLPLFVAEYDKTPVDITNAN